MEKKRLKQMFRVETKEQRFSAKAPPTLKHFETLFSYGWAYQNIFTHSIVVPDRFYLTNNVITL